MINQKDSFEAWVGLIDGLDEAREHLAELTNRLHKSGQMEESEFAVYLGHVYAHLNRVWNRRNHSVELTSQEWDTFSQFPTDIRPIG